MRGPTQSSPRNGDHPMILSYGLINGLLPIGEIVCLLVAGYFAGLGSGQMTFLQSLALPILAVVPYRHIERARRRNIWGSYDRLVVESLDVIGRVAVGSLMIWVYAWVFQSGPWLGDWLWRWLPTATLALIALRLGTRLLVHGLYRSGKLVHRVAIVGAGQECEAVLAELLGQKMIGRNYEIVGIFDERFPDRRPEYLFGYHVQQGLDPLLRMAPSMLIDTIIVTWPISASKRIATTMEMVRAIPADIMVLLDFDWLISSHMRIRRMESSWYLQVMHRPLIGTRALLKAIEDYVVASVGILLTAPIMTAVAIAIWCVGDGPILFRQKRVGFNNNEFEMLKFRSMVVDPPPEAGRDGTLRNDPRVTRIGRFIRRSSIDELPQLFNVLRGEMSIVGPRAHVPDMLVGEQTYRDAVAKYAARHRVKPGITGWAQINGMRGGIRDTAKASRGVDLDLDYIDNWSIWLDLVIMLRTLFGGMWGTEVF
jgi:Undecaprenyl-phosphate glucose phosphotransferase